MYNVIRDLGKFFQRGNKMVRSRGSLVKNRTWIYTEILTIHKGKFQENVRKRKNVFAVHILVPSNVGKFCEFFRFFSSLLIFSWFFERFPLFYFQAPQIKIHFWDKYNSHDHITEWYCSVELKYGIKRAISIRYLNIT